jgi:hypothetical protein
VHYHRDHLWYFSRHTLVRFVEAAGLEIVACGAERKVFNLNYLLEILARNRNWPMISRMAAAGLRCLPSAARGRLFSIREGLLLIARRPTVAEPTTST